MYKDIETYKYRMLNSSILEKKSKLDYEILELIREANKKAINRRG